MDTATFQRARLIPITGIKGDQEQERRATSALLAVLEAVPEFARTFLKPLGAPAGKVQSFIEPAFVQADAKVRPDGLIVVERGATKWSVAIEVKTNKNNLVADQLNSYLDVCRDNSIDALLTISNEVLTLSGTHPTTGIDNRKLKKIKLHHFSWIRVLTEAQIQKDHRGVSDPDQAWILGELIRYLESPSSGALEFTDMGDSWVTVRQAVTNGTLSPTDGGAVAIVNRFESLLRYVSFKLSARLGADVTPVVGKSAKEEPQKHMKAAVNELVTKSHLKGALKVQNTVAPLELLVDLRASQILSSVTVEAPREGRPLTKVNWLLRQLKSSPPGTRIETRVKRVSQPVAACLLSEAMEHPEKLLPTDSREISNFTITLISSMGVKRGDGSNSFVSSFVNAIDSAYLGLLQNLQSWTPKAPKMPIAPVLISSDQESSIGIREHGSILSNEADDNSPPNFGTTNNPSARLRGEADEPDIEEGASEVS
jgi:hypothetical protein